jgi:hypothetical protein
MTPTGEDLERLTKQNAMLMRALMRVKAERDALAQQLAEKQAEASR